MTFKIEFYPMLSQVPLPYQERSPKPLILDLAGSVRGCVAVLQHSKTPNGVHLVKCLTCGYRTAIITTGALNDPDAVIIPCLSLLPTETLA